MEKTVQDGAVPASAGRPSSRTVAWPLARKVSAALVAILFFTLATTACFTYYKFESVYSSLVQSRYQFVVFTIKKKVEDSLNLGFALRQLRQVQEEIEREKVRDSQVLGIEVYDARGEVLFDTDRGAVGTPVPEDWLASITAGGNQPFGHVDDDTLVVGLPLVNTLGKVEGGVVLRYPRAYLEHEVGGLLVALFRDAALALVAFAVVAVAALYRLFGGVTRKLGAMEHALGAVLAEGGQAVPDAGADTFEERFAEFVAKTHEAVDHIGEAIVEVERLDRLA